MLSEFRNIASAGTEIRCPALPMFLLPDFALCGTQCVKIIAESGTRSLTIDWSNVRGRSPLSDTRMLLVLRLMCGEPRWRKLLVELVVHLMHSFFTMPVSVHLLGTIASFVLDLRVVLIRHLGKNACDTFLFRRSTAGMGAASRSFRAHGAPWWPWS